MGAIASVLQWHCGNCSFINPTEQTKCLRCGTIRQIKDNHISEELHSQSTIFGSNSNCTVIRKPRRIIENQNQINTSPKSRLDIIIQKISNQYFR